jgi:hypothetical protein
MPGLLLSGRPLRSPTSPFSEDFMSKDKPLQFPDRRRVVDPPGDPVPQRQAQALPPPIQRGPPEERKIPLHPEQERALATVLRGETFVCIGIRPTPGGADTISSVYGDPAELRAILPHLQDIVEKAFTQRGI